MTFYAKFNDPRKLADTRAAAVVTEALAELTAADIAFEPAGNIAAENVQDAIEELDTEKEAAQGG